MFCCMRASVSGLMALLVLWFFPLNIFIHSFKVNTHTYRLNLTRRSLCVLRVVTASTDSYLTGYKIDTYQLSLIDPRDGIVHVDRA